MVHSRTYVYEDLTEDEDHQCRRPARIRWVIRVIDVVVCSIFAQRIARSKNDGTEWMQPNQRPGFVAAVARKR